MNRAKQILILLKTVHLSGSNKNLRCVFQILYPLNNI